MTVRNAPDLRLHAGGITEWTRCPQCGAVAEIRRRDVLQSTAGPLEHVGIICVARHTFFLPAAVLDQTADGTSTTSDASPKPAAPARGR